LKDLLLELKKEEQGIAIAIDQQVVPKSQWQSTQLNEYSQVFIFESIAGG
jgi:sulfur carrier protein